MVGRKRTPHAHVLHLVWVSACVNRLYFQLVFFFSSFFIIWWYIYHIYNMEQIEPLLISGNFEEMMLLMAQLQNKYILPVGIFGAISIGDFVHNIYFVISRFRYINSDCWAFHLAHRGYDKLDWVLQFFFTSSHTRGAFLFPHSLEASLLFSLAFRLIPTTPTQLNSTQLISYLYG